MTKAVFFDIDDTLVDTSSFADLARHAAIESMCNNGLPLEPEEAYDLLKDIIKEKGSNYSKHFNILTEEVLGKEDPLLVAIGMTTYHNVKFALLRPFPRTSAILIYLKSKGYKLGAITNGITIKQWEKLVIYIEACRRMACDVKKSIMIGNKLDVDCMGAVNAGMSAILVNSTLDEEEKERVNEEDIDIIVLDSISDVDTVL